VRLLPVEEVCTKQCEAFCARIALVPGCPTRGPRRGGAHAGEGTESGSGGAGGVESAVRLRVAAMEALGPVVA
jgi:hypothetical protein